jgi:hypothetical protein
VDNILGPTVVPGMAQRKPQEELHAVSVEEPGSLDEATCNPNWQIAMVEELKSIEDNDTWDIVDLPDGHRVIGLKWVYKAKKYEQVRVVKHKEWLVAKGYIQKPGIDHDEAFVLVVRMHSARLILAIAAHEGRCVHHLDVKPAFLNNKLEEELYVQQPTGFAVDGQCQVLKLRKALYGLGQSPRVWYSKLHASLIFLGFVRHYHEHAIKSSFWRSRWD